MKAHSLPDVFQCVPDAGSNARVLNMFLSMGFGAKATIPLSHPCPQNAEPPAYPCRDRTTNLSN